MPFLIFICTCALVCAGCDSDCFCNDAAPCGTLDSARADSVKPDLSPPDSATPDRTTPDLSPPDSAPPDQAVKLPDAGVTPGSWITINPGTFLMGSPTTEPCRTKYESLHMLQVPDFGSNSSTLEWA